MKLYTTTLDTPIGDFMILGAEDGIHAAGFTTDEAELRAYLHNGLKHEPCEHRDDLGEHTRAVKAYFDGDIHAIDAIPVVQDGTPFLQAAWSALRAIPAGDPITYRELAARAGNPDAPRAAGSACGRNAVAVIVPCHRVVRTDGSLGGFAWGLEHKRWLLAHERENQASN
jgi:methylated-DNA-[protein]-cysteine S-methyltransferase